MYTRHIPDFLNTQQIISNFPGIQLVYCGHFQYTRRILPFADRSDDLKHLAFILKNKPFNIKFFHQLGLLQCYLDSAPEGSEDAHIYRRLPIVSRPYAYECSNLCSDIFSTAGRKNAIKSSKLFVVESEVMENVYLDMVKSDMKKNQCGTFKEQEKENNTVDFR